MGVVFKNHRLRVGHRREDWSDVWYEPDLAQLEEDESGGDGAPMPLLYSHCTGEARDHEPMEGEVCWIANFDPKECESKISRERAEMQRRTLYDAWRYLNETNPTTVQQLEDELDRPNCRRWQSWFALAIKFKRVKMRGRAQRRRTRQSGDTAQAAQDAGISMEELDINSDSDDSAYGSDLERQIAEERRQRKAEMPPPSRRPNPGFRSIPGPRSASKRKDGPGAGPKGRNSQAKKPKATPKGRGKQPLRELSSSSSPPPVSGGPANRPRVRPNGEPLLDGMDYLMENRVGDRNSPIVIDGCMDSDDEEEDDAQSRHSMFSPAPAQRGPQRASQSSGLFMSAAPEPISNTGAGAGAFPTPSSNLPTNDPRRMNGRSRDSSRASTPEQPPRRTTLFGGPDLANRRAAGGGNLGASLFGTNRLGGSRLGTSGSANGNGDENGVAQSTSASQTHRGRREGSVMGTADRTNVGMGDDEALDRALRASMAPPEQPTNNAQPEELTGDSQPEEATSNAQPEEPTGNS